MRRNGSNGSHPETEEAMINRLEEQTTGGIKAGLLL
jgi:hypothetical protein